MRIRTVVPVALLAILLSCGNDTVKPKTETSSGPLGVPYASAPVVDGVIEPSEWAGSVSRSFSVDSLADITVRMKHDSLNLYLLFIHDNNVAEALIFPEVHIDAENDKSDEWDSNDWWFHVSGSDCEARGEYAVWNDCLVRQPDWDAAPNYELSQNPPPVDAIEIRIPLNKPGIAIAKPFGLLLTVEYVPALRASWPTAGTLDSPATWGIAVLN